MKPIILSIISICLLADCQQKPKPKNTLVSKVKDTSDMAIERLKNRYDSLKLVYHKLTPQNRKDYILTIDQTQISTIKDSLDYSYGGRRHQKFIYVPVALENRSNDTLKYLSMTCSRWDIFRVNNNALSCFNTVCEYNVPDVYNLPPRQTARFVIPLTISQGTGGNPPFKVGMNLQLYFNAAEDWGTVAVERMIQKDAPNVIWSNEVHIP